MGINTELDFEGVCDLIDAFVETIDFTLPGTTQATLAEDVVVTIATGIAERSNAGLDADDQAFKPNSPDYARYKNDRYSVDRPGELGGQTFSLLSLKGKVVTKPDEITMTHGTGTQPSRAARNGTALRPGEAKATDTEKGVYLTEGGREFYGVDEKIAGDVVSQVGDAVGEHLKAIGL